MPIEARLECYVYSIIDLSNASQNDGCGLGKVTWKVSRADALIARIGTTPDV